MIGSHQVISIPTVQWVCQQPAMPGSFGTPAGRTLVCSCGYHTRIRTLMDRHQTEMRDRLRLALIMAAEREEEECGIA